MTRWRGLARAVALAVLLAGCGAGVDELMETAAFEELQNNRDHARALYQQVIDRFPGTPQAAKAAERLRSD